MLFRHIPHLCILLVPLVQVKNPFLELEERHVGRNTLWSTHSPAQELCQELFCPSVLNCGSQQHYWTEHVSNCLPCSKANLLMLGCDKGNYSVNFRLPSKEYGQLMPERPKCPDGFQGRIFKGNIYSVGCSSGTSFWLIGDEVTGWCFKNLNHQLSDSS